MNTFRFAMCREYFQELAADLLLLLTRSDHSSSYQHLGDLAEAITDYGRMIKNHLGAQQTTEVDALVDERELARRFREHRRTITRALSILETDGRAERSQFRYCWKLRV